MQTTEPSALPHPKKKKSRLTVREMTVFSMLGALMFCSKLLLEWAPNIHLLALFIIAFTLVYRTKALVPIYVFVLLTGVYGGFNVWWVPYLYVWAILWAMTMLIPKRIPKKVAAFVYPAVCALHGFAFGIFYAPGQALLYGLSFEQMLIWIAQGMVADVTHGIGNLFIGTLVLPLSELLKKLIKSRKFR